MHQTLRYVFLIILFLLPVAAMAAETIVYADQMGAGFSPLDATHALQTAIDSSADTVIVRDMGSPWMVNKTISLNSDNQRIIFEPNVVVYARRNYFTGTTDCLFRAISRTGITLKGYGAKFLMRKSDYQNPSKYTPAEWRHTLALFECTDVNVLGLTFEKSGGDGIYIGYNTPNYLPCRNITIRDVVCDDNHRQGISITSAENVLIENVVLKNTSGTGPSAGIDLEPDSYSGKLSNIVCRNLTIENNTGHGVLVFPWALRSWSDPVSILFENVVCNGSNDHLYIGQLWDGVRGTIEFRNVEVYNTNTQGVMVINKSKTGPSLHFNKVKWSNVAQQHPYNPDYEYPIMFVTESGYGPNGYNLLSDVGGVSFTNCQLFDMKQRDVIKYQTYGDGEEGLYNITGNLCVVNPNEVSIDAGAMPVALAVNQSLCFPWSYENCFEVRAAGYGLGNADLDLNCEVNLLDFSIAASTWQSNLSILEPIFLKWLECVEPLDINCDKPWEN